MAGKTERILLAHGSGGRLSHELVGEIVRALPDPILRRLGDSAEIEPAPGRLAFTTDTYTVSPAVFPGGDIGRLAVCGTVNDLAAAGATPRYLSLGLVIEEGLEFDFLRSILRSVGETAREAEVRIVTGDTKVVERGGVDRLFINTAGVGELGRRSALGPEGIRAGDRILINGTVGDHGAAVLSRRHQMGLKGLRSDCAPLWSLVQPVLDADCGVRFMRDATRGGLATVLNEAAEGRDFGIVVDESAVPVSDSVRAFCELLGYDPLYIANEGKMVLVVDPGGAERALRLLRAHPLGAAAAVVGEVSGESAGRVLLRTTVGGRRILDMLVGDQFPRIC
ncbi:MAG: hydrogenase expression/formation protein HypE [Elusimicrobiota bacterium]